MPDSVTIPDLGQTVTISDLGQTVTIPAYLYTKALDAGSYALSGQAAELIFGYSLIAANGSISLGWQDFVSRRTLLLSMDGGSVTVNGQDANLSFGYPIAAEQGSFTLSGQDVAFVRALVLTAEQGSVAVSGQAANITRAYQLETAQGSITTSGQDVVLNVPYSEESSAATGTTGTNTTMFNLDFMVDNGATINTIKVDHDTAETVTVKIAQRTSANNFTITYSEGFSHGGAGVQEFTLTTPQTIPGTGDYYAGHHGANQRGSYSGGSRAYKGGNIGVGASGSWNEDTGNTVYVGVTGTKPA